MVGKKKFNSTTAFKKKIMSLSLAKKKIKKLKIKRQKQPTESVSWFEI